MCPVSPSVLLYVCGTIEQPEVCWLDCSTMPPKEICQEKNIFPTQILFSDMCFVTEEVKYRKGLLIVAIEGTQGIHAYNVDTNSLQWKTEIEGMARAGVCSDGHGHLFVCDRKNDSIHMISVSDGRYLRCLIKTGEQGLGKPGWAA